MAAMVGDRIAAKMNTLAYFNGDKFGRVERIVGACVYVRMEVSLKLVPFAADDLLVVRELALSENDIAALCGGRKAQERLKAQGRR